MNRRPPRITAKPKLSVREKMRKEGFDAVDLEHIENNFENRYEAEKAIGSFLSILMPIKLSGFTNKSIKECLPYMGKAVGNKNVWRSVGDLNSVIHDYELSMLAHKAGLTMDDAASIKENGELTRENLETMILIKKL